MCKHNVTESLSGPKGYINYYISHDQNDEAMKFIIEKRMNVHKLK